MSARIAVLKFGGTSVADRAQRALAVDRIVAAIDEGFAPVAVVSAMGRAPSPYATDSLLALLEGAPGTAAADVLLSTGELIAAAVVADALVQRGIAARALTGAQAGIRTDDRHGDAEIVQVDPQPLQALIDAHIVPVVAGFQGANAHGVVTTLGRGGTDLSAVAIGAALGARVDIYTDVDGAMTADPRRIPEAQRIERASFEEMAELATHGAKVMHHKAAEYAHRTDTPYSIKGLASDTGTYVDAEGDVLSAVTGVTSSGRVTWVRVIRGDIEHPVRRMQTELEMFQRIADAGISIDQVTINQAGVAFVVNGDRGNEVRSLLGDLNVAVRVREGCAKLSIVGAGMRNIPGVVSRVVDSLSEANVEIIHATDSNITISVLVPQGDVARAEAAVHARFHLQGATT